MRSARCRSRMRRHRPGPCAPSVILRMLRRSDALQVHRLYADPFVAGPCRIAAPASRTAAAELLFRWHSQQRDRTMRRWALALRHGRLVGTCGLMNIRSEERTAYLSYALSRAFWGRGVMRKMLRRVLDIAFGSMGLACIYAEVEVSNLRSRKLLENLGFEFLHECRDETKAVFALRCASPP